MIFISFIMEKLFTYLLRWLFFVWTAKKLWRRRTIYSLYPSLKLPAKLSIRLRCLFSWYSCHSIGGFELISTFRRLKFIGTYLAVSNVFDLRFSQEVIAEQIWDATVGWGIRTIGVVDLAFRSQTDSTVSVRILLGLAVGADTRRLDHLLLTLILRFLPLRLIRKQLFLVSSRIAALWHILWSILIRMKVATSG